MRFTFPSLAKPNMRWVIYEGESPAYSWRDSCRLSRSVSTFDTMGDGEVQHSGEMCVNNDWRNLSDFVYSIIPVVITLPPELLDSALRVFAPYRLPTREQAEFIAKLRYDESKTHYVNFDECKKSTSDSKRHDKRWERLEYYFDGSFDAFVHGISKLDCSQHLDPLQAVYRWGKLTEVSEYSRYTISRWMAKPSTGSVYNGVDADELDGFSYRVERIGDHLARRVALAGDTEAFRRFHEHQIEKQLESVA